MNAKIKAFAKKASEEIARKEAEINVDIANDATTIDGILLEVFGNESPYVGEVKNKVFFTYSDHYHANSGTWMSVGSLHKPHMNMDDRGYIKGVATDLDGYVKLRSLLVAEKVYYNPLYLYKPTFKASKKSAEYKNDVERIEAYFAAKLRLMVENKREKAAEKLKEKTNLSLKYYIRDIY